MSVSASTTAAKADVPLTPVWLTLPQDTAERRQRIAALGQQIMSYIEFMCAGDDQRGASGEEQDKAVAIFYDKLIQVERQLARIHDALKLV